MPVSELDALGPPVPRIELRSTAAARAVGTAWLQADYSQYVVWFGSFGPHSHLLLAPPNGFVDVRAEQVEVITGTHYGRIAVHVEVHGHRPELDLDRWDEAVEFGVRVLEHGLIVCELMGGNLQGVPLLATTPGLYRVRVQARNRDQAARTNDFFDEPSPEQHAVLVWPAPPAPVEVLKTSDQFGASRRTAAAHHPHLTADAAPLIAGEDRDPVVPPPDQEADQRRHPPRTEPLEQHAPGLMSRLGAAPPELQREVACFAARRAVELAGLTELP